MGGTAWSFCDKNFQSGKGHSPGSVGLSADDRGRGRLNKYVHAGKPVQRAGDTNGANAYPDTVIHAAELRDREGKDATTKSNKKEHKCKRVVRECTFLIQ